MCVTAKPAPDLRIGSKHELGIWPVMSASASYGHPLRQAMREKCQRDPLAHAGRSMIMNAEFPCLSPQLASAASLSYVGAMQRRAAVPRSNGEASGSGIVTPAHVPEKWTPVFRKGQAPTQESRAHPDSTRSECTLSVPVPTFLSLSSSLANERRNQRDTRKYMILVWLWI